MPAAIALKRSAARSARRRGEDVDADASAEDSDYLDSGEPRKKRRVGEELAVEGESDDESGDEEDEKDSLGSDGIEPVTDNADDAGEPDDSSSQDEGEEEEGNEDETGKTGKGEKTITRTRLSDGREDEPFPVLFSAPSRIRSVVAASADGRQAAEPAKTTASKQPTAPSTSNPLPTSFSALDVCPWLVQSLANVAIRRPTAIQAGCIPAILRGHDCIGGSRTGSGKTVAFAIPILQAWAVDPSAIFALVLTPTRELALQIYEQFQALAAPQPLKALLVTGGADMRPQAIALAQRPHLVIATPGRLADHIRTSGEDTWGGLRRVRYVVLDEADRLLAGGGSSSSSSSSSVGNNASDGARNIPARGSMLPDVETCLGALPPPTQRQTLLFTATVTPEVRALKARPRPADRLPVFVCEVGGTPGTEAGNVGGDEETALTPTTTTAATTKTTARIASAVPDTLHQTHILVPVTHREHYLHVLLTTAHNAALPAVIVFVNRASTAAYLHHLLRLLDHRVTALYAGLPQRERTGNLGRFRAAAARVLVATDVAARGLDIPEVALVVNYDVPRDPDAYIHRVGRTARAGRAGAAVTLVGQRDVDLVLAIEARVGRKLAAWSEPGVNLETRVTKEALALVGAKKREALLEIEENRTVGGKRQRGMQKLRAV
ncbi:ATP dependent RNA helicase (Dbp8) [Niveomyces insectorum RCEF 264]|uniref:ATP dependent RNA helicase (Dbp8) n=1 Tax=Niveomyces insectorum RCEF 264 TaxID=1081102 RepID=A0A162MS18_9HYPO|nr:ATP dependent RNA helicase (Dbp8) [Niveomyces insectorum RCEF 264]